MTTNPPRAHVQRLIRAPAADIFSAWTDPRQMSEWMSPAGTATAEVDLRVGGRFRLVMADEHLRIEHTGEYRDIDPPHLLWSAILNRLEAYLDRKPEHHESRRYD